MQQSKAKNESVLDALDVQVSNDLTVTVIPHVEHKFLMPSAQVAAGYGVSDTVIRKHKENHADELLAGVHFIHTSYRHRTGAKHITAWTQLGVIRLGFFIKSERAKLFRDWAERVIVAGGAVQAALPLATPLLAPKPAVATYSDVLEDLLRIDDKRLRLKLAAKFKLLAEGKGGSDAR